MSRIPIDWRRVTIIAGVIFLVLVIVDFNARLEALDRLNSQADVTRAEATQVASTQIALQTKIAYAGSNQIVEEQARSEERMIQDGDKPFVVIGDESAPPIENTQPTPMPTPQPNWQRWLNLFFGEE